jgi:hypothetical protein
MWTLYATNRATSRRHIKLRNEHSKGSMLCASFLWSNGYYIGDKIGLVSLLFYSSVKEAISSLVLQSSLC